MQQPRQRRSQRNRAQYPEDSAKAAYPTYPEYPPAPQYPEYVAKPSAPAYRQNDSGWQQGTYSSAPAYSQQNSPYPPQVSYPQAAYPQNYDRRFAQNSNSQPPYPPRPPRGNAYEGEQPPRRPHTSHDGLWLLLIILCIAALAIGGFSVSSLYSSNYPAFREKVDVMAGNRFFNGVHIDGVHIGGMTMEEARNALNQYADYSNEQFSLAVIVDGKTWRITQSELPLQRNTEAVLQEAFTIGRQGTTGTLGANVTPFEMRYQHAFQTNQNGAYLYTEITYDKATVRSLAETIASRVYVAPVDATIYDFDFATRSFRFTPEQVGAYLDAETVYAHIVAHMDARNYNGVITLNTQALAPITTAETLSRSFGLLATYTTDTTADYNRNVNIRIAADAVTGVKLESGETFSFNETTGRRTVDKGYLPAGAIAGGASIEETGGGVCQVSSTLFNTAVMANMEIVYSSPHAWPSNYVAPGRDATVDWQSYQTLENSLDFKFKNSSDHPIYIVAYLTGNNLNRICKCTVEIYGVAFQEGVSVDIQTELVSTTPMPLQPEMRLNTELPYGTEQEVRKAREGYVYKTYRVYYRDGVEMGRELLRTSTYRTYTQIIEYNY